jgi:YidC/Oxa1 family membrane protein insertase
MDKNTTTGLVLIGAVVMAFMFLNQPNEQPNPTSSTSQSNEVISDGNRTEVTEFKTTTSSESEIEIDSADNIIFQKLLAQKEKEKLIENYGIFYGSVTGEEKDYFLENDKIRLSFSSKGARITNAEMVELDEKGQYKYRTYSSFFNDENKPLSLFEKETSQMSLTIVDAEKVIPVETSDLFFDLVKNNDSLLVFRASAGSDDKYLEFSYRLSSSNYDVDFEINYHNIENDIKPDVDLKWSMKGLSTEKLAEDERNICTIMYRYFGSTRDYLSEMSDEEDDLQSNINWIAFKHKFFSSILLSDDGLGKTKIVHRNLEDDNYTKSYASRTSIPSMGRVPLKFLFVPNDYDILESYDYEMEDLINLGGSVFAWVNRYLIDPVFKFLMSFGFSLGLVILLLTIIVKIVIMPLTYKNYMSTAKTKVIKPEMNKISAKYEGKTDKNAAMKKQQETMALYKQTGVNPMAGCIPMIIQMPILIAVFRYFPASLSLRHKEFLWAEDLSSFDSILDLGFEIPFYGDHVSLFALLMAGSTLIYTLTNSSQMTAQTQPGMPNMKVIMYFMPIMFIFFFNKYSAGLSYYYFCGNIMNIGIMWGIKKFLIDEDKIRAKIESNKKKIKKKSRFQQRLEEVAKQQQKKRR